MTNADAKQWERLVAHEARRCYRRQGSRLVELDDMIATAWLAIVEAERSYVSASEHVARSTWYTSAIRHRLHYLLATNHPRWRAWRRVAGIRRDNSGRATKALAFWERGVQVLRLPEHDTAWLATGTGAMEASAELGLLARSLRAEVTREPWCEPLLRGVSQGDVARHEGVTRQAVCMRTAAKLSPLAQRVIAALREAA